MVPFAIRKYAGEITTRLAAGVHERAEHELFYLFEGTAMIYSELGIRHIHGGTLVIIPKEFYHRISYDTSEGEPLRCTCHFDRLSGFDALVESKLTRVSFATAPVFDEIFREIRGIFEKRRDELSENALLKAYVGALLAHLGDTAEPSKGAPSLDEIVRGAVAYVNKNLSASLSAEEIATHLHVSPSYLRQLFRREMMTPLHQYVLQKRLILANKMIMNGVAAQRAARESGFSDYSNFYVQYKKRFGAPPSRGRWTAS